MGLKKTRKKNYISIKAICNPIKKKVQQKSTNLNRNQICSDGYDHAASVTVNSTTRNQNSGAENVKDSYNNVVECNEFLIVPLLVESPILLLNLLGQLIKSCN